MSESILSAVLSVLFEKLMSPELIDFATQEGVGSELKKWEDTLKMMNAVLIDVEEKQLGHRAVRVWSEELQDLAYDAEDILDECATEALRRELKKKDNQAGTIWACKLIPACCIGCTPHALWSDFSMRAKINVITSRMLDLCQQRTALGLVEIHGRRMTARFERFTTTGLVDPSAVYGRDYDNAKIVEMVLTHEPGQANFGVIPIVGMGGIGKTTLAAKVYHDQNVLEHFDLRAWVYVSDDFDVLRISKAILELVSFSQCDMKELNAVQNVLNDKLKGKRFLIVLDDVWSENDDLWEELKAPFMAGAAGSKIIVTTRSFRVATTMQPHDGEPYDLQGLSDDDCWSMFLTYALGYGGINDFWNLNIIREKVVQRCKGLPLAVKALGGLLRSKETEAEWMHVLNSQIWDLEVGVLPALKLSYDHLPSYLKRCFAYCAIFPKDYEFEKNELIFLWMAEGLIQKSSGGEQLEDLGGKYFHDLLLRSIIQQSNSNTSKFIMHDLINDLAVEVSQNRSCRLEDESLLEISTKIRYTSCLCDEYNHNGKFTVLDYAKQLRTYLAVPPINDEVVVCYISNIVVSSLLSKFKKLRVLSLQKYFIVEVPKSIGDLRLLRYLNLSNSDIRCLPESINSLCNLQTLILRNCRKFLGWPGNMENLINLRHLDFFGASLVREMPMGIRKWKYLRTLSNFIVGKDSRSNLEDLEDLKSLCGELHISRLENATNFQHRRKFVLTKKKDLKMLLLEWGSNFYSSNDEEVESRDEEMDKSLLDMLQPHKNLEKLVIKRYGGKTFSSWVENGWLSKMTVLELEDCKRCTSLPSIGLLGSLKSLSIKGLKELESINSTFYGDCQNPFESLETLCFENLEKCESWDPIKENESFCRLQELSIVDCPKLSERLPNGLSSLKKLVIKRCEQLVVSLSNITNLCELEFDKCKRIVCTSSAFSESLEYMTLSNISDFGDLSRQELTKVQNLKIEGCKELIELWQNEIFIEKPHQGLYSLKSVKELDFRNCNTLTTLLEGIKQKNVPVEELRIESCDSLNFIFRGQFLGSLKKLRIEKCEKLQCLLGDNEDTSTSLSSTNSSPSLTTLPLIHQLSTTLTSLFISDCSELLTCHVPESLKHLEILNCSNLNTLLPASHLPESLETLTIRCCPQIKSIVEKFHNNKALSKIFISSCHKLKSLPRVEFPNWTLSFDQQGFFNENLRVWIKGCEKLSSQVSYGNLEVHLDDCPELEALPKELRNISSLQIFKCPNLSLSEEDLPTKLRGISIEGLKQYKVLIERGFHNFPSLIILRIYGGRDGESFQETDMEITLPPNLTELRIGGFPKLKCLPFENFEDLPSLEYLSIDDCPRFRSLPSSLPSSLLRLEISSCPFLKEACQIDRGREWRKIADIPCVKLDNKFIYDPED